MKEEVISFTFNASRACKTKEKKTKEKKNSE